MMAAFLTGTLRGAKRTSDSNLPEVWRSPDG